MKEVTNNLKKENYELKVQLNDLDQYSRKRSIIVHSIKYTPYENVKEVMKTFAVSIDIIFEDCDINGEHRLPTKKGIPP